MHINTMIRDYYALVRMGDHAKQLSEKKKQKSNAPDFFYRKANKKAQEIKKIDSSWEP